MKWSISKGPVAAGVAALIVLSSAPFASAQTVCRGDVDNNGTVTVNDVAAVLPILFGSPVDTATRIRADVNDDGAVSGADAIGILEMEGFQCPPGTPTASPTPTPGPPTPTGTVPSGNSPSATATGTPTPTNTRPPTPTPTRSCMLQQGVIGQTINGLLTTGDCQRSISGQVRYGDAYLVAGTPGTAVQVAVTTSGSLVPFVVVIDADGQFDIIQGAPPIEFAVTTTRPYEIFVTTSSEIQVGPYALTLTQRQCSPPQAIVLGSSRATTIDGSECPDPALPSVGSFTNPVDLYTFTVPASPTNVSITMQQLLEKDDIFPLLSVLGPGGFEVVTEDDDFDCSGDILFCSRVRFLALEPGTYTIIASGDGDTGRYSLTLTSPTCKGKPLGNIPASVALNCPGSSVGCMGTLSGSTTVTRCAAPLPNPGGDGIPEPGSPADLFTFTAEPGDVISVEMQSEDDPHLYLLGPAPENPLVVEDSTTGAAQLAATLVVPGTYTIVAANNVVLFPPEFGDPAEEVNYTLFVQKCPVQGLLNPTTGRVLQGEFSTSDCFGFDGIPFETYVFNGTKGQFVTTTVTSPDVDGFVRVFAPDGSRVANDNDPFEPSATNARANRILPMDGRYVVEVSSSPDDGAVTVTPPLQYLVQAKACPTTPAAPGSVSGMLEDADCGLTAGRRADVYTFQGAASPSVASLLPPSDGCVVGLLAEGTQTPREVCATGVLDMPVRSTGTYGFMVAGKEPTTRGAYGVQFSRCPVTTVGYGSMVSGTLTDTDCADAEGAKADWFFFQEPAGLVQFNFGVFGSVRGGFPLVAALSDEFGSTAVFGSFSEDPAAMLSFDGTLAALLKIAGAMPSDRGSYTLSVDTASVRQ
ncbi:MAG: dockerin type I domain-containing protein [Candidatus Binatia bacterium]